MIPRVIWLLALLLGLSGGDPLPAQETDRAIGVAGVPTAAQAPVPITGNYWALLIGIDEYAHALNLKSPVKDVQAVRAVLETRYGFHPSRIKQLLNAEATRNNIINTLYGLGREAKPEDSVFIYYAGHGQYDEAREHGWWVPTEGEPRQPGTLIENTTILRYIKGLQARHVYLVADSCFSGTLFGTRSLPPINDRWYAELYKERSRWGLTSGGTEPVADSGKEGHSPFAYFLLKTLRDNEQPYLVPSTIYEKLARLVANDTNQEPRSEPLTQSGDEGGQFVFRLTTEHPPDDKREELTPSDPMQLAAVQLAMEHEFWNSIKDSQGPEGFKAYLNQYPEGTFAELARHRLEQTLEAQRRTEEEARRQTKETKRGRRFRDCLACPELVVVPAGRYEMGSPSSEAGRDEDEGPVHWVTISEPLAVGVYEVSRGEFGQFVEATGYSTGNACRTVERDKPRKRSGRHWRAPGFAQTDQHPVCV